MSVKVKATQPGFYAGARRRIGETFVLAEGDKPGSWMEVVGEAAPEPAKQAKPKAQKAKGENPETFGEIAKRDAEALTPKGLDELV